MKIRSLYLLSLVAVVLLVLSACGQVATPQVVEKVVTKEVEKVVTKEVEKVVTKEVEKVVTKEVEKIVEVTPEPPAEEVTYDRTETLYTSGKQWGPPTSWNPIQPWAYATGTLGLCYETLFLYDPLTNEYIPWLAESGEWVSDTEYELKVRQGVNWTDGEPLTAADVVFTFELGKLESVYYHSLWNWLESAEQVDDYTVKFTFSEPLYQEWGNLLYSLAIVPKHLWEGRSEEEIASGDNLPPLGTGAYMYETHSEDRMVWVKNENWWAKEQLGLDVAPKRIVDIVNPSNNVALGLILQANLDLSNNFLPGIATLVKGGYGISTWYPEPPYMLSGNTAFLFMNTTKKPMDDPAFRKAMAYAIDVDQIVNVVYGSIVKASDPTGLLPVWSQYVDQNVVDELGFSYDPDKARQILADAGYKDTDGDGFVEAPDGSKIELKVIVPFGWTDWMESIRVIASSAQAVGINVEPDFPDFGGYSDQLYGGTFDMAINNFGSNMSNTPWTFYDWLFRNPITEQMNNGNFGRYDNQEVFDLVVQLDKTPIEDVEGMKAVISDIQRIQLTDMPAIPLWYNGAWAQWNSTYWTNWPSAEEGAPKYLPITWNGYWNMTGLLMLTELQPASSQ